MVRSTQKVAASSSVNPARQRRADTGVWPCTLDGCSKVFAREADLKRHQRTTKSHLVPGSGVGSPCPLCEATFTRTDAMRRHLKSRHNGKTPETLHLPDVQIVPSTSPPKGKRRACSTSDASELSASDGEHAGHRRSTSSSRAQSAAPPYYDPTQHAPPPSTNLSPAILYQAAMSYEIRHALAPSSSPTSSLSGAHGPPSPTLRPENEGGRSRRDAYHHPPEHEPFTQYPPDDFTYHQQQHPYDQLAHHHPQHYSPASDTGPIYTNGVYSPERNGGSPSSYVHHPWSSGQVPGPGEVSPDMVKEQDGDVTAPNNRRGGGRRADRSPHSPFAQQEPLPSGLAALAMHAARIRPMSPLPDAKQGVKTKSELESALGPAYSR